MSFLHKHTRLMLVALSCLALGAGASAIASAGAATGSAAHPRAGHRHHAGSRHGRHAGSQRWLTRAVHGDLTLATKHGFKTVTFDRGTLTSVSGQQLTLTEGTKRSPHRTVTLTIPATARVRDNRAPSSLSHLTAGERVMVIAGLRHTRVIAHTSRKG